MGARVSAREGLNQFSERHPGPAMKRIATYAQGAAILCTGVAAYIVQDLIMKIASGHYPIHQALALRALTAIPIAVLIIYMTGSLKTIKGSTRPMLPRSMLTVICNLTYYLAIAALPLATVGRSTCRHR